jgi:hypothetical protein
MTWLPGLPGALAMLGTVSDLTGTTTKPNRRWASQEG